MPIDPSIPLQIRGPQIDSPMQVMGQMMSLQQLAQRGRSQGLRMQQEEDEIEKLRVFNEISRKWSGFKPAKRDKGIVADLIAAGYATEAQEYQTKQLQQKKLFNELGEAEWEEAEKGFAFAQQTLTPYMKAEEGGREATFNFAIDALEKRGIDPAQFGLTEQYDPNKHDDIVSFFYQTERAQQNFLDSKKPQAPGDFIKNFLPGWAADNGIEVSKLTPSQRKQAFADFKVIGRTPPRPTLVTNIDPETGRKVQEARILKEGEQFTPPPSSEPLYLAMVNGEPTWVPRSQAAGQPGVKTLYDAQGRAVTGGQAGVSTTPVPSPPATVMEYITNINTVLDQVEELEPLLSSVQGPGWGQITLAEVERLGGLGATPEQMELAIKLQRNVQVQAFQSGGKQLTQTELALFQKTSPNMTDLLPLAITKTKELKSYSKMLLRNKIAGLPVRVREALDPKLLRHVQEQTGQTQPGGEQPGPVGEEVFINPETGEKIRWDGQQWVIVP